MESSPERTDDGLAELRRCVEELVDQAERDRRRIEVLERAARADRAVIATLEAEGIVDREAIANLEVALVTARRIGAATGALMARYGISDGQAFDLLRETSQARNRKLRDVAEDVLVEALRRGEPSA